MGGPSGAFRTRDYRLYKPYTPIPAKRLAPQRFNDGCYGIHGWPTVAREQGDECRHSTPWPTDTFCQGVCSIRRLEWLELGGKGGSGDA